MADDRGPGLTNLPKKEWPDVETKPDEKPIEALKPGSTAHSRVLNMLNKQIEYSEREMDKFYSRWNIAEYKAQAYISLGDHDETLKTLNNDKGKPPKAVAIIVPYTYATIATIVTYLLQTFAGRRPLWQLNCYRGDNGPDAARQMEMVLQYNADHTRFVKELYTFLTDGQLYGVSVFKTYWLEQQRLRTRWKDGTSSRNLETVYQGNEVCTIDPFMFFPDPRVPMTAVNRRGEFVYWRSFVGKHQLLQKQADGIYSYVNSIPVGTPDRTAQTRSQRSKLSGGESIPGRDATRYGGEDYYQEDQGTVIIVPKELGLGESEKPERWIFTWINKAQIVQAEPFTHDHDMHPVAVAEPYTLGYGFGQIGMADMIGPLQDLISWFFNSHVDNVRRALNDMIIVDPMRVEIEDLKKPGPGKFVRLKAPIIGSSMDAVIKQLSIVDVTGGHMRDAQEIVRIGQLLTAVTDNVMGIQQAGGRKTATEVRTAIEAGSSRLAALARLISAQALVDVAEQMVMNIQQFMTEDFYYNIMGAEGIANSIHIKPDQLIGDFNFPVHDGTIPLDRIALLDVWKEIFVATRDDPVLNTQYDRGKMFEYMAELGGVKNLNAMKLSPQVVPDAVAQAAGANGAIPAGTPRTAPSSLIQALGGPPPRANGVL